MHELLIFGGTIEGRNLAEALSDQEVPIHVCVATAYGRSLLPIGDDMTIHSNRMNVEEMQSLIESLNQPIVIDATHPHALEVTKNIRQACASCQVEVVRLVRAFNSEHPAHCHYVPSIDAAVEWLKDTEGVVLLTTGSQSLEKYTALPNYKSRLVARVLSTMEVASHCHQLGFEGKNLICMQGPFSEALNYGMLKQIEAKYLVTKDSGSSGGFEEKLMAAKRAGVTCIVIGQSEREAGLHFQSCLDYILNKLELPQLQMCPNITLVGIGMGNPLTLTQEAIVAIQEADIIIGAKRLIDSVESFGKPSVTHYLPEAVKQFIECHKTYKKIVIVLSGDAGFYSGAKKLMATLKDYQPKMISGISTISYFASKIGTSWEDAEIVSAHGRTRHLIMDVLFHKKVFVLMDKGEHLTQLCQSLMRYELKNVTIHVGENLSSTDERILVGTPETLLTYTPNALYALFILHPDASPRYETHGLSDLEFIREKVPMTKEEIRTISLSKLKLTADSVVYDIGAGTGSVSMEMALRAYQGKIYAIEKNETAIALIEKNKLKFKADNVTVIKALAPDGLNPLEIPTHAFIGGSSHNFKLILEALLQKNPKIRVVVNVTTLETLTEVLEAMSSLNIIDYEMVQVNIAKSKKIGHYTMMEALNPVNIISFIGRTLDAKDHEDLTRGD